MWVCVVWAILYAGVDLIASTGGTLNTEHMNHAVVYTHTVSGRSPNSIASLTKIIKVSTTVSVHVLTRQLSLRSSSAGR